ncbi:unnamed protein product [Pieris macdunnoughi]|uniref:SAM domain-containing protein n=1 Tax=Pieris macdunnoughi TaxID=345717 RepID=A0A821SFT1_9NEOP|nr:unnamed protein product [Pieris macdunnoughi]
MNGTFYEQLGSVAGVFEQWGTCERTVVACALARRVPWPGLRLVQRTVEAALQNHVEDERLERDANDETLLATLLAARVSDDEEEDGERLLKLLALLPLLRTDNERAKNIYVGAAPALVQRCVDAPRRTIAPDLCRQLLSYLLVHPALSLHDQRTLTQWLRYLENHISGNRNSESVWQQRTDHCLLPETNIWNTNSTFRRTIGKNVEFRGILDTVDPPSYTDLLQESFSKNGRDVDISIEGDIFDPVIVQAKSQRSNSLTPPSTNFLHMSSSAENLSDEPFQKPRSFSLSSEHSLGHLRPIGVMYGTTGSETRLDDLRSNNYTEHPGMSTVAQWLKSLRLHKYVWLFTNITYEQMMAMDEKHLEKLGVTKGARHKILLSIKKLSERSAILESVQSELKSGAGPGPLLRALDKLRGVMLSPMPPTSDLPAALVAALDLASECLTGGGGAEGEDFADPMSLHCWLVEKALHHESFVGGSLREALRRLRHRLPPRQFFQHVSDMPAHRRHKPRWRAGPAPRGRRWTPPTPRGKSHSYPPFPPHALPPAALPQHEDYSSLDALCLQMTEQAID